MWLRNSGNQTLACPIQFARQPPYPQTWPIFLQHSKCVIAAYGIGQWKVWQIHSGIADLLFYVDILL